MKILIVDDHQLFRIGLSSVLKKNRDILSIDEAENGLEAINLTISHQYDIILMDICMPVLNGVDATKKIKQRFPETRVIALSMYDDQKHVMAMIEAGASGYIVKNTDSSEINKALTRVRNNEFYFSRQISDSLISSVIRSHTSQVPNHLMEVSNREKEILKLICQEFTSKEIASKLFLSEKTVEWHRLNLLQKTNSRNTVGLVRYALRNDLIDIN